jgi:hypothetical protein
MIEHQSSAAGTLGDISRVLEQMAPRVVGLRTYVLDAFGTCGDQYRLPYRCITVMSQSAKLLTAFNQPIAESAPQAGPGVAYVRIGGYEVINFAGYAWSIYGGNAGELVTVTAYARPQQPYSR